MKKVISVFFPLLASFVVLSQNPTLSWAKSLGGESWDYGYCIITDDENNSYIGGSFKGTVDFDLGSGENNLTAAKNGSAFIQKNDVNGNLIWVKQTGDVNSGSSEIKSLAFDKLGNICVGGNFSGTIDFDSSNDEFSLTSSGHDDGYVQKIKTNGDLIWVKKLGGSEPDFLKAIAVDNNGNILSTGFFNKTADFNPGSGVNNLEAYPDYYPDIFVSKLNSNGDFLWVKKIGGPSSEYSNSVAVDMDGNIFITGSFISTTDFDPGVGTNEITSYGVNKDAFILKLDSNGSFNWVNRYGSAMYDLGNSVTADNEGNVYVTGGFDYGVGFDPPYYTSQSFVSRGEMDVFVQKLDTDGSSVWVKQMGGEGGDVGKSLKVDSKGDIIVAGIFSGTANFGTGLTEFNLESNGSDDIFIQKLNEDGDFIWAESFGGEGMDICHDIALDPFDNIYSTGVFSQSVDFDPGVNKYELTSSGGFDAFVQRINQYQVTDIKALIGDKYEKIYPNPTLGTVSVKFDKMIDVDIKVTNLSGEVILNQFGLRVDYYSFNLQQPKGVYFVEIISENVRHVHKLVLN